MVACRWGLRVAFVTVALAGCGSKGGGGTGGAKATGGATASGGTTATGGVTATGGATASGGTAATGGVTATGGASSMGGAVSTGGASATGGAGGTSATGGVSGSGGAGGQLACPKLPTAPLPAGRIVQFNDNGGWNWFEDERAVVDVAAGKVLIGSVASGGGRDGDIEIVISDLAAANKVKYKVGNQRVDERNTPSLVVRPDGKYLAMWSGRNVDCLSYFGVFDGTAWPTTKYDWTADGCPWSMGATNQMVSYSNLFSLSGEGKLYAETRSIDTTPNFLVSSDGGQTFSYYGRISANSAVGFVSGYYKFWSNGIDRIDFVASDNHPRDFDNSLWHGYLKGGVYYDSTGAVVDDVAADKTAKPVVKFTKAVATGSTVGSVELNYLWNHDIVRYSDGTIAILGQGRVAHGDPNDPDLRLIYARFDGKQWQTRYLGKAGHKLFADEQDFTGVGALHPDNPNIVYISTTVDPRDGQTVLAKHEIFQGVTCDDGVTWTWAPLTENSAADNLRPIVPKWDAGHTLLLWLNGIYTTSQVYKLAVVGAVSVP